LNAPPTLVEARNRASFVGHPVELMLNGWLVVFPSLQPGLIVRSVNPLDDWLRHALNPKLT